MFSKWGLCNLVPSDLFKRPDRSFQLSNLAAHLHIFCEWTQKIMSGNPKKGKVNKALYSKAIDLDHWWSGCCQGGWIRHLEQVDQQAMDRNWIAFMLFIMIFMLLGFGDQCYIIKYHLNAIIGGDNIWRHCATKFNCDSAPAAATASIRWIICSGIHGRCRKRWLEMHRLMWRNVDLTALLWHPIGVSSLLDGHWQNPSAAPLCWQLAPLLPSCITAHTLKSVLLRRFS